LARETAAEEDNRREILFRTIGLEWVTLDEDSPLPGKTLEESGIRPRTGASVIAVLRGDDSIPNPPPGFRFESDDTLVVLGHREQVEVFLATFARAPGSA
jgi:K+/H+ antiporter YhaU regulatory subunit KhtT